MRLFPAKQPVESVAVAFPGPLPKTKAGNRFILVIADRLTMITQVVLLKRTTFLDVAEAFASQWAFKYGAPKEDFLRQRCTVCEQALPEHRSRPRLLHHIQVLVPTANKRPDLALQPIVRCNVTLIRFGSPRVLG